MDEELEEERFAVTELDADRTDKILNLIDVLTERIEDEAAFGDAEMLSDLTCTLLNLVNCLT